jgi:hypothetical protein
MASVQDRDTVRAKVQFAVRGSEPYVSLVPEAGAGSDRRAGHCG